MKLDWNQPCCERCWQERNPGRGPVRIAEPLRDAERCAYCGAENVGSGIFVRVDPTTVPFPTREDRA